MMQERSAAAEKILTKVKSIKNELKELHPVLASLFDRIPSITHVENHHGPREFGADFVLVRYDEELQNEQYIGVVAKVDKITQSSSDVGRQIDECRTMPRVIKGNKTVRINEVWVVCCNSISKNAQDLFAEKHHISTSFYDADRLAKLISRYMPEYVNNLDLGVSMYLTKTEQYIRSARDNAAFSVASLEGYELEQQLVKVRDYNYVDKGGPRQKRLPNNIFDIINKRKVSLIDGQMGSGKTTLMQKAALRYCSVESYEDHKTLPILIDLVDFRGRGSTISSLIKSTLEENGIDDDTKRRYLVIVDGWDELRLDIETRNNQIDQLASQANERDDVKLLIAGRDIGEHRLSEPTGALCEIYRISPISVGSLIRLIERICVELNVSSRVAEDLRSSSIFKMLPKTPIAAMLLTKLLKENSQDIPSNLTELYLKYSELALGRWDIQKGLTGQKEYEVCERVCCDIAQYMLKNDIPAIGVNEAKGFFQSYLSDRNLDLDPESLYNRFVDRSELVLVNYDRNTFSFRHRTFMEFFYAKSKVHTGIDLDECSFDFYWSTAVFFWIGLMKDCPERLDELASIKSSSCRGRILKSINFGSFLLAGYQTPYETIERNINGVFIESAELYEQIRKNEVDTPLKDFSEMQLTAIFRYILADAYGYKFFKNALGNVMIAVEDGDYSDEIKASALFFLNLAYLESGGDNIFESMIDKIGSLIPLSIKLAIQHEVKDNKLENTKAVARIHRSIKKTLSDRSISAQVDAMYKKPLKQLRLK